MSKKRKVSTSEELANKKSQKKAKLTQGSTSLTADKSDGFKRDTPPSKIQKNIETKHSALSQIPKDNSSKKSKNKHYRKNKYSQQKTKNSSFQQKSMNVSTQNKTKNSTPTSQNSKKSSSSSDIASKMSLVLTNNNNNKAMQRNKEKSLNGSAENQKSEKAALMPLPHSEEDYSSNWKRLSATLVKKNKGKTEKKPFKRHSPTEKEKKPAQQSGPDIWFDDVDDILINSLKNKSNKNIEQSSKTSQASNEKSTDVNPLVKSQAFEGLTKVIAIDCEMVGVGVGGKDSVLARVSIVNQYGHCVYDKYVKPTEKVTDYRTHVSGIRAEDLVDGEDFKTVQKDVSDIFKGKTLVGHALQNDLKVLFLDHPKKLIRDTSRYKPFRRLFSGGLPSLKKLTAKVLSVDVQEGEHNSIQDAQAAMRLYTTYRARWEKDIKSKKTKNEKVSKR